MDMFDNDLKDSIALKIFIYKPKVLLVEDSPLIQRAHMRFLELLECSPDLATNAIQALRMYSNQYDLILMSIELSGLSGLEVSHLIRNETKLGKKHIPIIGLTNFDDLVKERYASAGIDDLLTKPASQEELQAILKKWLPHLLKTE